MLFSIKYTTWDRRKCSLFRVEGCSPKTNQVIYPIVKYTEKMGPGKSVHYKGVFTNQGCSLREVSLYIFFSLLQVYSFLMCFILFQNSFCFVSLLNLLI